MKKIVFVLMFFIMVTGCASMMAKAVFSPSTTQTYAPKSDVSQIEVLHIAPNRNYVEIGLISCKDTSEKRNMTQVKEKAREVGADAIIILQNIHLSTAEIIAGVTKDAGIKAIAIKYK